MFDSTISMKNQVTSLCNYKAAHFHLRNIGRIKKSIIYEACEKLIHALITSRLDYCNATLYGVTDAQHQRLQKMFNITARILTLTPPSDDIKTVLLETLHWLPVAQRIQCKILLLTSRVLHGLIIIIIIIIIIHCLKSNIQEAQWTILTNQKKNIKL